jgi:RIO-like serine/threonine protein kinase
VSKAKTVPCEACHGKGVRALKPHEVETLAAIRASRRAHGAWASSSAILARINTWATVRLKGSALANRLRDLRDLGLVERRLMTPVSGGREYQWRLT